jgi:hypothetical protein
VGEASSLVPCRKLVRSWVSYDLVSLRSFGVRLSRLSGFHPNGTFQRSVALSRHSVAYQRQPQNTTNYSFPQSSAADFVFRTASHMFLGEGGEPSCHARNLGCIVIRGRSFCFTYW